MSFLPEIDTSINLPFGIGGIDLFGGGSQYVPTAIDSLISSISNYKLSYPFKYEISFIGESSSVKNLRLAISCESITLPGKSIATQQIKMHGPVHDIPYEASFAGDLDVTFKLSGDLFERNYFETWQDKVINPNTNNLNYMSEYALGMEITQLDMEDNPVYRCVIEDVWPKTIAPVALGDETTGNNKQQIGFSYRKWRVKNVDDVGFLQGIVNRLDLRGRLNRQITELFSDSPIPLIPTAVGGSVINLPWGFDASNISAQGGQMISNQLGDLLG